MKKRLIKFLKNSSSIVIRFTSQGILFFNGNNAGGFGYLLKDGKVIKVPINVITLSLE